MVQIVVSSLNGELVFGPTEGPCKASELLERLANSFAAEHHGVLGVCAKPHLCCGSREIREDEVIGEALPDHAEPINLTLVWQRDVEKEITRSDAIIAEKINQLMQLQEKFKMLGVQEEDMLHGKLLAPPASDSAKISGRGAEQQQSPLSLHELNDSIKSLYMEVSQMSRSMCQEIIGEMKQSVQQIIRKEFEGFVKSHKDFEEQIQKQKVWEQGHQAQLDSLKAEDAKQEEVWIDGGAAFIRGASDGTPDAVLANGQPPQQQERSLEMSSAMEMASAGKRRERIRSASKNQTSASEERPTSPNEAEAEAAGDQEDYEPLSPLDFDELEKQLKEVDDEVGNFTRKLQDMQPVKDWRLASHAAVKKVGYLGLVNYLGLVVETEAQGLKQRLERLENARSQARDKIIGNKSRRGSKKRRSQRFERRGSLLL